MNANQRKFENNINQMIAALRSLGSAFQSIDYPVSHAPKARYSNNRSATKKGATHKVNPTFLSRSMLGFSPAKYRREHMGKGAKKKNTIHIPKGRNVSYVRQAMIEGRPITIEGNYAA